MSKKKQKLKEELTTTVKEDDKGRLYIELPDTILKEGHIYSMRVEGKKKKQIVMKDEGKGIEFKIHIWKNKHLIKLMDVISTKLNLNRMFLSVETWNQLTTISNDMGLTEEETFMTILHREVYKIDNDGKYPNDYLVVARKC